MDHECMSVIEWFNKRHRGTHSLLGCKSVTDLRPAYLSIPARVTGYK
jgi:hypothetical protein